MGNIEVKKLRQVENPELQKLEKWFEHFLMTREIDYSSFKLDKIKQDEHDLLGPIRAHYFKATLASGEYFVKIFHDRSKFVESELVNNISLTGCPEVNVPELHQVFKTEDYSLLVYDFVSGQTLQGHINRQVANGKIVERDIMEKVFDQIIAISSWAERNDLSTIKILGPARIPFTPDVINQKLHTKLVGDYQPFKPIKPMIETAYPGFAFDRHPRNMIVSDNKIYQTDFEIVGKSSQIFEIVKILREGITIIERLEPICDLDSAYIDQRFWELNAFSPKVEMSLLDYYYSKRYANESPQHKAIFYYIYIVAAAHSHLHSINKAITALKTDPNLKVAHNSSIYHTLGYLSIQPQVINGIDILKGLVTKDEVLKLNSTIKDIAKSLNISQL